MTLLEFQNEVANRRACHAAARRWRVALHFRFVVGTLGQLQALADEMAFKALSRFTTAMPSKEHLS